MYTVICCTDLGETDPGMSEGTTAYCEWVGA